MSTYLTGFESVAGLKARSVHQAFYKSIRPESFEKWLRVRTSEKRITITGFFQLQTDRLSG
jgi:hypothetical protein